MSEERPYPPSDQKLAKLRSAGIFARTPELFFFAALGALLLSILYFERIGSRGVLELFEDQFRKGGVGDGREAAELWSGENLHELLAAVVRLTAVPLVISLVAVLLVGLFQSRFLLISPGFDLGRIVGNFSAWSAQRGMRLRGALLRSAQLLGLLALGYLAALSLMTLLTGALIPEKIPFDSQLVSGETEAIAKGIAAQSEVLKTAREQLLVAAAQFRGTAATLLGFAALLALVCRFAAVLAYRRQHGMSREELQAELRESEASPEMKGAVRDLRTLE